MSINITIIIDTIRYIDNILIFDKITYFVFQTDLSSIVKKFNLIHFISFQPFLLYIISISFSCYKVYTSLLATVQKE